MCMSVLQLMMSTLTHYKDCLSFLILVKSENLKGGKTIILSHQSAFFINLVVYLFFVKVWQLYCVFS